jgi:hypothetical protein
MIKAKQLVSAARARRYKDVEGFLDDAQLIKVEVPERYSEQFEALAADLARQSGVSVQIAEETIMVESLRAFYRFKGWGELD